MGHKRSSIDLLPLDIRTKLIELLRDPRVTQLEVTKKINQALVEEGHEERVSKSAVNRYAIRMEEVGEKLRKSRELAEMWIGKLGAAPQGEVGKLINEILRTLAFDLSMFAGEGTLDEKTAPQAVKMLNTLALSMQRLEKAANLNTQREKEIRQQAMEEAAKQATETAKAAGVSEDTIDRIWKEVLRMA